MDTLGGTYVVKRIHNSEYLELMGFSTLRKKELFTKPCDWVKGHPPDVDDLSEPTPTISGDLDFTEPRAGDVIYKTPDGITVCPPEDKGSTIEPIGVFQPLQTWGDVLKEPETPEIDKTIDDHWEYVKGVMMASTLGAQRSLTEIEHHYKTAFRHGYKHGVEDTDLEMPRD